MKVLHKLRMHWAVIAMVVLAVIVCAGIYGIANSGDMQARQPVMTQASVVTDTGTQVAAYNTGPVVSATAMAISTNLGLLQASIQSLTSAATRDQLSTLASTYQAAAYYGLAIIIVMLLSVAYVSANRGRFTYLLQNCRHPLKLLLTITSVAATYVKRSVAHTLALETGRHSNDAPISARRLTNLTNTVAGAGTTAYYSTA